MRPVREALRGGADRLRAAGIENPGREARLLLAHALDEDPTMLLDGARPVPTETFCALVQRRAAREPLALITGRTGFWSLDLEVSPATLIPRADTESLIEAALVAFPDRSAVRRVLDLGTGTGCLLLAVLTEFPHAVGIGVDLAPEAASLAARNARANGLAARALLLCGCWAEAINGAFDLILANPPYIPTGRIAELMPEVADHEPRRALDGGQDGGDAYRCIIPDLRRLLRPNGAAILEIGVGQVDMVAAIARNSGLSVASSRADLGGIIRALTLVAGTRRGAQWGAQGGAQ